MTKQIPDAIRPVLHNLVGYTNPVIDTDGTFETRDYFRTGRTTFVPHLFLLFWILASIHYFTFMIISGVVADWYFTPRDKKSGKKLRHNKWAKDYNDEIYLTNTPICDAVCRTLRYHIGTIVFAALIIAIIRTIRYFVLYTIKICDGGARPNRVHLFLKGFVQCLLKLLECILDKVNKHALIYNAIYGDAFCPSVCGSFSLIWSNLIRAAFISLVSRIITVLGKVMITLVVVGMCWFIMIYGGNIKYIGNFNKDGFGSLIPLFIIGCISFVISKFFLSVYDTAIDTVFMCFLVDEKQNWDGGMLADPGLKKTIKKYENQAKDVVKNGARFRYKIIEEKNTIC